MKQQPSSHQISLWVGMTMVGIVLLLMLVGLVALPADPNLISVTEKLTPPSEAHPLGTDDLGRDILSRLMVGARTSFGVGCCVVAIGLVVGTVVGAIAGYFGGWVDLVTMKLIDTQMAFPGVLIALMVLSVFGTGTRNMILALSILSLPRFARMARSGFLRYREAEFVRAARVRGAGVLRIMVCHIFPNLSAETISTASLSFAAAVVSEAGLGYLGLGADPRVPSFGQMLSEAQRSMLQAPWYVLIPVGTITLLVLGFHLIGDGLQQREGER